MFIFTHRNKTSYLTVNLYGHYQINDNILERAMERRRDFKAIVNDMRIREQCY